MMDLNLFIMSFASSCCFLLAACSIFGTALLAVAAIFALIPGFASSGMFRFSREGSIGGVVSTFCLTGICCICCATEDFVAGATEGIFGSRKCLKVNTCLWGTGFTHKSSKRTRTHKAT